MARCAVAAWDGPVYLRLPVAMRRPDETTPLRPLTIGRGEVLDEGDDIAILASGVTVGAAREAAQALAPEVSATIVNMHTIKPLDEDLVRDLASRHRAVLTVENHSVVGGLGSAVAETLAEAGIAKPFARLGVKDVFAEGGSTNFLLAKYGMDSNAIVERARQLLN